MQSEEYKTVAEIPTDKLAARVVGSLIMAKGNLNEYEAIIAMLIRELRGEPHLEVTPITPDGGKHAE